MTSTNSQNTFTILCITVLLTIVASVSITEQMIPTADALIDDKKEILIASWNLYDFGTSRAGNNANLQTVSEILTGTNYSDNGQPSSLYDVIFVQEIKSNGMAFDGNQFLNLCDGYLDDLGYECLIGTSLPSIGVNGENYGIIYKPELPMVIKNTSDPTTTPYIPIRIDNNPSNLDMARPPMQSTISFGPGEYNIVVYNNHIAANNQFTSNELKVLKGAPNYYAFNLPIEKNILLLGDFNADCNSLYGGLDSTVEPTPGATPYNKIFDSINWYKIFTNADITNFAANPCAYDKMVLNKNMNYSYSGTKGIIGTLPPSDGGASFGKYPLPGFKSGGTTISDHKLIWAQFNYGGIESADDAGILKQEFMDYIDPPTCKTPDEVFTEGEGFVPNSRVDIYVTSFPSNGNTFGEFKKINSSIGLTDIRDDMPNFNRVAVTVDANGDISHEYLLQFVYDTGESHNLGAFNIVVDVNRDGLFTNSIDVVDVFNQPGFILEACERYAKIGLKISVSDLSGIAQRWLESSGFNKPEFEGSGLGSDTSSTLYIMNAPVSSSMGNLNEKSVFSASVKINSNGTFTSPVTWSNPIAGEYNVILDVNNDNIYNSTTDLIDYSDEIGFIVADSTTGHNDIIHLGDNGLEREVYNVNIAKNIYTLAKNLPMNSTVDIYTISERLLKINNPKWSTWENTNSTGTNLLNSAAPVFDFGAKIHTALKARALPD